MGAAGSILDLESDRGGGDKLSVDEFIQKAYRDSSKQDGLQLILQNANGRKAFIKFLNTENGDESYHFYLDLERVKRAEKLDIALDAKQIVETFQKPDEIGEQLLDTTKADIQNIIETNDTIGDKSKPTLCSSLPSPPNTSTISEIPIPNLPSDNTQVESSSTDPTVSSNDNDLFENLLKDSANETMVMLALKVFPKFIQSEAYKEWRAMEKEQVPVLDGSVESDYTIVEMHASTNNTLAATSFRFVSPVVVTRLFGSGSWIGAFITAAEGLPVCVTLADASPDNPGFPLLYVNRAFEKLTGYHREKIRGTNCKFLQGPKSERQSIQRMAVALSNYQPVKVCITNYRPDGKPFLNLLAMKPVFDLDNNCVFIIGVQYDTTATNSKAVLLKLATHLLETLPDIVPISITM